MATTESTTTAPASRDFNKNFDEETEDGSFCDSGVHEGDSGDTDQLQAEYFNDTPQLPQKSFDFNYSRLWLKTRQNESTSHHNVIKCRSNTGQCGLSTANHVSKEGRDSLSNDNRMSATANHVSKGGRVSLSNDNGMFATANHLVKHGQDSVEDNAVDSSNRYLYAIKEDLAEWFVHLYPDLCPHMNALNFMELLKTGEILIKHANNFKYHMKKWRENGENERNHEEILNQTDGRLNDRVSSVTNPSNFSKNSTDPPNRKTSLITDYPSQKQSKSVYDDTPLVLRRGATPGSWHARDNVYQFICFCCLPPVCVRQCVMFETEDLVCEKNEKHVLLTLLEVARRGVEWGLSPPTLIQMEIDIDNELDLDLKLGNSDSPPPSNIVNHWNNDFNNNNNDDIKSTRMEQVEYNKLYPMIHRTQSIAVCESIQELQSEISSEKSNFDVKTVGKVSASSGNEKSTVVHGDVCSQNGNTIDSVNEQKNQKTRKSSSESSSKVEEKVKSASKLSKNSTTFGNVSTTKQNSSEFESSSNSGGPKILPCGTRHLKNKNKDVPKEKESKDGEGPKTTPCGTPAVGATVNNDSVLKTSLDFKTVDEMVGDLMSRCECPSQFPIIRVSPGKYRIGDSQILIFVRILRSHVMVRVGGGWDTLQHYLNKHDPCRRKCNAIKFSHHSTAQTGCQSGRSMSLVTANPFSFHHLNSCPRPSGQPQNGIAVDHHRPIKSASYTLKPTSSLENVPPTLQKTSTSSAFTSSTPLSSRRKLPPHASSSNLSMERMSDRIRNVRNKFSNHENDINASNFLDHLELDSVIFERENSTASISSIRRVDNAENSDSNKFSKTQKNHPLKKLSHHSIIHEDDDFSHSQEMIKEERTPSVTSSSGLSLHSIKSTPSYTTAPNPRSNSATDMRIRFNKLRLASKKAAKNHSTVIRNPASEGSGRFTRSKSFTVHSPQKVIADDSLKQLRFDNKYLDKCETKIPRPV